jgi:hypothetical protein
MMLVFGPNGIMVEGRDGKMRPAGADPNAPAINMDDVFEMVYGPRDPLAMYRVPGLQTLTAPIKVPDALADLVAGYDGPKMQDWTHPKVSLYQPLYDRIYLSEREIHRRAVNGCNCGPCKLSAAVDEEESYSRRLLHELAHSTGHKSRLDRVAVHEDKPLSQRDIALEELLAESVGTRILRTLGVQSPAGEKLSEEYINSYLEQFEAHGESRVHALAEVEPAINEAVALLMRGVKSKPKRKRAPRRKPQPQSV